jgi:hypothetical protein
MLGLGCVTSLSEAVQRAEMAVGAGGYVSIHQKKHRTNSVHMVLRWCSKEQGVKMECSYL